MENPEDTKATKLSVTSKILQWIKSTEGCQDSRENLQFKASFN